MSEKKTPMASEEKSQTGTRTTKRTAGTTININTMGSRQPRDPEPKTKQHTDPIAADAAPGAEDPPKPPLYDKPQMLFRGDRETHYASPLAATLFARFDENYTGVQPSEFAVFNDTRLRDRGYI